jgi:hypothetical protein
VLWSGAYTYCGGQLCLGHNHNPKALCLPITTDHKPAETWEAVAPGREHLRLSLSAGRPAP